MTIDRLDTTMTTKLVLYLFEKEKGGVGSTGTAVTVGHHLHLLGRNVEYIEASLGQNDIANAYGGHHKVHTLDLADADVAIRLIDLIGQAPPGTSLLANIPGGRAREVDACHTLLRHAIDEGMIPDCVHIIWTMGRDAASRDTLLATLDGALPGRVSLNLPQWGGKPEDYELVDQMVIEAIEKTGGNLFVTPSLPKPLYDLFRSKEIALDRIMMLENLGIGPRAAFSMWERSLGKYFGS